jgi:FkbM family methyltransferase
MTHPDAGFHAAQRLMPMSFTVGRVATSLLVRPDTMDHHVVHEVVQTYRVEELARQYSRQSRVMVVDIGAHIGTFSVLIATLLPRAVVHAFEPAPENFEVLQANIRHAGLEGRVHATHAAVGRRTGFFATADISRSPDLQNTGGHSVTGVPVHEIPPSDGRMYAPVLSLDALFDREPLIDILKIDCEGSEFEILYSLTADQLGRIDTILGEVHSCAGFAGSSTNGLAWNGVALVSFLGQAFDSVATSHRVETETAVLETFHAIRDRPHRGRVARLLQRIAGAR